MSFWLSACGQQTAESADANKSADPGGQEAHRHKEIEREEEREPREPEPHTRTRGEDDAGYAIEAGEASKSLFLISLSKRLI